MGCEDDSLFVGLMLAFEEDFEFRAKDARIDEAMFDKRLISFLGDDGVALFARISCGAGHPLGDRPQGDVRYFPRLP